MQRKIWWDRNRARLRGVSDSRDEEFPASAGWLNRFLRRNNFTCKRRITIAQKDARELTEKLAKFVTFSSKIFEAIKCLSQINTWSVIETNKRPGYYLVFYSMITLPARGERHASARPTVLSCRHSREVTRRDSS